jgi:hypothetical protein
MSDPDESPDYPHSDAAAVSPASANPGEWANSQAYDAPAAMPGFNELPASSPAAFSSAPNPTLFQRNRTTMTTLAVVAGYLVLAATTRIVLLGIFPMMLGIRAFQRKEPLAPLAIVAAVGALLVALSVIAHH